MLQCSNEKCGLRFPDAGLKSCPNCGKALISASDRFATQHSPWTAGQSDPVTEAQPEATFTPPPTVTAPGKADSSASREKKGMSIAMKVAITCLLILGATALVRSHIKANTKRKIQELRIDAVQRAIPGLAARITAERNARRIVEEEERADETSPQGRDQTPDDAAQNRILENRNVSPLVVGHNRDEGRRFSEGYIKQNAKKIMLDAHPTTRGEVLNTEFVGSTRRNSYSYRLQYEGVIGRHWLTVETFVDENGEVTAHKIIDDDGPVPPNTANKIFGHLMELIQ